MREWKMDRQMCGGSMDQANGLEGMIMDESGNGRIEKWMNGLGECMELINS